jgi:tRNA pseudouridine38-40 synthase
MPLWKSILTYDGTPFHGWQVQPGLPTVQGTLAQAIHQITGETVLPQGSGRTDTGVHALAQVASFSLKTPVPTTNFHLALNRALPPAIRILTLEQAPENFHARHSALCKTYEYRIFPARPPNHAPNSLPRVCSPMLAPYVWDCHLPLDLSILQQAAHHILGTHDFTSFAATDPDLTTRTSESDSTELSAVRTIHHSDWHQQDGLLIYRITGSGFLHHMVRNLVGTFTEAAAGRIPPDSIPQILATRNRRAAGPTAPARGLFLVEVLYSKEALYSKSEAHS